MIVGDRSWGQVCHLAPTPRLTLVDQLVAWLGELRQSVLLGGGFPCHFLCAPGHLLRRAPVGISKSSLSSSSGEA
jgi:hypothetical protein